MALRTAAAGPVYHAELIFPAEHWHNHASCIVECRNGDLLVCWYSGSGERNADDVRVLGARKKRGDQAWSKPFLLADTPGFPDTNPCLFIDPQRRLWLIWQTIIANEWHTALIKYKIASAYEADGAPRWDQSDTILLKPGLEFADTVNRQCAADEANLGLRPGGQRERARAYLAERRRRAADKYFSRMGWMTRAHPYALDGKRLILPLYSDGYNFSLMALSDDGGATWTTSTPLVGPGNVQPSLVRRKDGTLVAYMRNNGPPPKRLLLSESRDAGKTWTPVTASDLPNPGSGAEVLGLRDGRWVLVYNDTERGRHSLALSLSDDEGKTWKWTRHLERSVPGPDATHASYPSIIQAQDGTLHVSYTYTLNGKNAERDRQGRLLRECIKHAHVNVEWIRAADSTGAR
ncbi:MAG TPA: exo-alpha-sialidase [Gemmataceae bacterium]|nr:exo-alpha-sialidase [Gemmataceae bacterium]